MPPKKNSDFVGKSHGYWEYPDPVIPLMAMLSSKAQRKALQKAIDNLGTEDLYGALCKGDEDLSDIPEKIRKQIAEIINKDESLYCRFDEIEIASFWCDFGTGIVVTLYARRRGNKIAYRCLVDNETIGDEWILDHYLSVEEVPQYLGLDINYVDDWAVEEIPEILERKLKDIDDREAIREGILSCYFEHHGINSEFYPLTDYYTEKYIDAVEKPVSDAVHRLRDRDSVRRHYVDEKMDDLEYYDLIEYWDLVTKQQMADGTFQDVLYQATIKWFNKHYFKGLIIQEKSNASFKVLSGYAFHGPYMGTMSFEVTADDGSVRNFHGDIIDELSIFGYCTSDDENEHKDAKARWSAFRYENIYQEKEEDDEDNDDTELSPDEIPCPFCGERDACSHFLADFDSSGENGEYRIGLGGGALYDVDIIGDFFETVADCYARARYKGKGTKLPKAPKGVAFRAYVRALKEVRLDAKAYKSEEDYCSDFYEYMECYAELVRGALLELLDFDVYEKEAATDAPLMSSNYALWYCSDANATAAKLKDELARCLLDFKRENGLI